MNLTARGWTVLGGGVAWCVVALANGQRDLWWPGLFLVLLPLVSRLLLVPGSGGLTVTRRLGPDRVSVGEPVQVHLVLDPRGISVGGVAKVRDRLPEALGAARWFGSAMGLGLWQQSISYEVRPRWRGRHRIGPLDRTVADGLGLARSTQTIPGQSELLVTPRVEPLVNLRGASGVGLATDTSLLRTGLGSADDVLVREYQQGDDVRRIHWRSTAHAGQLMVRREERSWDPSATIVIDNRSRGYSTRVHDERLEWGVSAAASIAIHLLADGFDLSLVGADGHLVAPHRVGTGRESMVLEHLADLGLDRATTLRNALAATSRGAEGQLLVAILSRVDTGDARALAEAARAGRTCWALLLASSTQLDAAQAATVRDAGWTCVVAGPGTPVADAWRQLGREGTR
ncbi:DUF58 domain-containing protein, partial [Propionicimonas sp.]|uniref:DUF58 domain-containing protein n=1 Tax=Propionicimonas sp. TaxID=1955623 RepID=UPI0039E671E4